MRSSSKLEAGPVKYGLAMRTIIVIAIVNLVEAFLNCADICKSQGHTAGNSKCSCSQEQIDPNAFINMPHMEEILIVDDSPIFYEPFGLSPHSVSFLEEPFYLQNPTSLSDNLKDVQYRKLKRSNNQNQFEVIEKHEHSTKQITTSTDTLPVYLDIDVYQTHDKQRSSDSIIKEVENIEELQQNLMDCINLHVLVDLDKDEKYIIDSKYIKNDQVKKYIGLSIPELMVEIKNKCHQPHKIIETNLKDIKRKLLNKSSGKPIYTENNTNTYDRKGLQIPEHNVDTSNKSENRNFSPNNEYLVKNESDEVRADQYPQMNLNPVSNGQLYEMLLSDTHKQNKTTNHVENNNKDDIKTTPPISATEKEQNLLYKTSPHVFVVEEPKRNFDDMEYTQKKITNELSSPRLGDFKSSESFSPEPPQTNRYILDFTNNIQNETINMHNSNDKITTENVTYQPQSALEISNFEYSSKLQSYGATTSISDKDHLTENYAELNTRKSFDIDSKIIVQKPLSDLVHVKDEEKSDNLQQEIFNVKFETPENIFINSNNTESSTEVVINRNTFKDSVQVDSLATGSKKDFANDLVTSATYELQTKTEPFPDHLFPSNITNSTNFDTIDILIPKEKYLNMSGIQTHEFKNNSIISNIQSAEKLPYNDFLSNRSKLNDSTAYTDVMGGSSERTTYRTNLDLNNQNVALLRNSDDVDKDNKVTVPSYFQSNIEYVGELQNNTFLNKKDSNTSEISAKSTELKLNDHLIEPNDRNQKDPNMEISENTTDRLNVKIDNQDIIGNIYLLFHGYSIPARFIQNRDGEIKFGIDGQTLCDKIENKGLNNSLIISALCNCSKDNNCMDNILKEISQ